MADSIGFSSSPLLRLVHDRTTPSSPSQLPIRYLLKACLSAQIPMSHVAPWFRHIIGCERYAHPSRYPLAANGSRSEGQLVSD